MTETLSGKTDTYDRMNSGKNLTIVLSLTISIVNEIERSRYSWSRPNKRESDLIPIHTHLIGLTDGEPDEDSVARTCDNLLHGSHYRDLEPFCKRQIPMRSKNLTDVNKVSTHHRSWLGCVVGPPG